jgi:spore germination cell wall hydrolase CwlJ-like protein
MSDETDILARTCWGEERSLGKEAMQAVANVVLNRVKAQRWWGLTIIEVCKKPGQFDCWNPDDPNCEVLDKVTTDDPQFAIAMQIATDAVNGVLPDITNGAVAYYNTTIPVPYWARGHVPCFSIGNMVLYNDIS